MVNGILLPKIIHIGINTKVEIAKLREHANVKKANVRVVVHFIKRLLSLCVFMLVRRQCSPIYIILLSSLQKSMPNKILLYRLKILSQETQLNNHDKSTSSNGCFNSRLYLSTYHDIAITFNCTNLPNEECAPKHATRITQTYTYYIHTTMR